METIPHESLIYRAIRSKRWKAEKHNAFLLRRDEEELSITTKADCTKDICFAKLNTCFGEFKLIVEKIRELGLEVIPKPLDDNPYHAAIINLPLYTEETLKEAERMARLLARQVVIMQERPK